MATKTTKESGSRKLFGVTVERGITPGGDGGRHPGYVLDRFPLMAMEVGESFAVPLDDLRKIRGVITKIHFGREKPKFTTAKISQTKGRVWRIF